MQAMRQAPPALHLIDSFIAFFGDNVPVEFRATHS